MKYPILFKNILCICLALLSSLVKAQSDIGITLNVVPPYSPRISEYVETPGKMLLIIRNNTNQVKSIYLYGSIVGDNGVSMNNDPNVKPSSPLVLQPYQVYTANNYNLQELFSVEKYKLTGITQKDIIVKNGLPEGNYSICVRAYDFNTGVPLSGDAPQGCKMLPIADLEPPFPIKPFAEENIKAQEPQTIIFSWTVPAGAEPGTQYKLRIVEMLNPAKNINDAYLSNTVPVFFETIVPANVFVYGPAQPKLAVGRKYAWAVTAIPGAKKIAYKNNGRSEIRSFVFGTQADNNDPVITQLYPADGAVMPAIIYGGSNAFSFKWSYTNPGKKYFNEDVKMFEIKEGQSKEQAVAQNPNCISTKEPGGSTGFNYTGEGKSDGKKFAWYVVLYDNSGKPYKSDIRTFSMTASDTKSQNFGEFTLCGFPIKVTSLTQKGTYLFSGTGTTTLGAGGKEFTINFWDLTIQPFGRTRKPGSTEIILTNWRAVKSNYQYPIKANFKYWTHIDYDLPKDIGGTLWYDAKSITFTPYVETVFLEGKNYFETKEISPYQKVELEGSFKWETPIILFKEGNQQEMLTYKASGISKFDYQNWFDSSAAYYMAYTKADGSVSNKNLWLYTNGKVFMELNPKLSFVHKGKTPKFEFTGLYTIKNPIADKQDLTIGINSQSLIFSQKIKEYACVLNKDKSASCSFDSVQVDLVHKSEKAKITNLKLAIKYNNSSFAFGYKKSEFNSSYGLYCQDSGIGNSDLTISGFSVNINKSKILLIKNKLFSFYCLGSLNIPFINQKAAMSFDIGEDGVNKIYVDCDENKPVVLFQNLDGNKCTLTPMSGELKPDRIDFGGKLTITNTTNSNSGIVAQNITMPRFFIKANGDVGLANSLYTGSQIPYQVGCTYMGFKFSPFNLILYRVAGTKYNIKLSGMVVLADNLASDTKTTNFSTSAEFDVAQNKGGGPPPNQEVSISSSEVTGGRTDAIVDFGMKFKYFNGDKTFGNGFRAEGNFGMQQPNPMKVFAKMIIAKAPAGYNYWFFEAGQENVMQVATGLLDLGIYGFTGRVYYKMTHSGSNINASDYVPNSSSLIGVYGLTKLKTLTDNGIKFWGDLALEIKTANYGLESIRFRGNGEFVSTGVGSSGLVRAKDCELNFYWKPKRIYAQFNLVADFYSAVTAEANAGFDISSKDFHLWAGGTGYLFGSKDFSTGNFLLDLTQKDVNIYGDFNMVDINKSFDFGVCEPSIVLKSGFYMDAYVKYSPFLFKGEGGLYGTLKVAGCRLHKTFALNLAAQVMFPKPTCVSVGYKIKTPLKDFTLGAGVKNGGIFFGSCF